MANKGRGGRGGQGRRGGGSGRPGRGGGSGRGGGGFVGRTAGQQQQQPQQQQESKVQLRLFSLTQHLVLQCFNPLDDLSRKNAFEVMGWPRDNYLRRQQVLREQLENSKKAKAEQEKKKKEAATQPEEEASPAQEEGVEGEATSKEEAGLNDAVEGTPDATETNLGEDKVTKDEVEVVSVSEIGSEDETKIDDNNESSLEEPKVSDDGKEVEDDAAAATTAANSDDQGEEDGVDEKTEDETQEETQIDDNDNPLLLPLLSAPIDPQTLLDRLNTRRLFARLLHYKREQKRKVEEEAAKALSGDNAEGDTIDGPEAGLPGMGGPIQKMFRDLLKEKVTADRIWRKNMTIEELANLEWDELLKVANLRNNKKYIPYDPIPTQHELLLFSPCPRAVGILASYPRSGNSLMRTLYEHTTLRVTGSDMQGGLAKHDLVGEMAVGANMVQFVKTHFPERQGSPAFRASRVVLLVRNPFDAIESYFNLMITGEHTKSISAEARQKATKYFEEYALKEIRVWKLFHQFWMKMDVPILLIRYEDIVRYPDKVMERVLPFVLEVKRMDTFFLERIDRCIRDQQEIERLGSYKPRSGGIGKAVKKYSPELFEKIMNDEELRGVMKHLHYQELLEKPPEEWSTLTPLENYAIEYLPSWAGTDQRKVVMLNTGNLARTQNEETRWRKIKMEMGLIDEKCMCAECVAERAERDAMGKENVEEKKLEDETEGGDCKEKNEGEGNEENMELDEEEDEEDEEEGKELVEEEEKEVEVEEYTGIDEKVEVEEVLDESKIEEVAADEESIEEDTNASNDNGSDMVVEEEKSTSAGGESSEVDDEEFNLFLQQLKDYTV